MSPSEMEFFQPIQNTTTTYYDYYYYYILLLLPLLLPLPLPLLLLLTWNHRKGPTSEITLSRRLSGTWATPGVAKVISGEPGNICSKIPWPIPFLSMNFWSNMDSYFLSYFLVRLDCQGVFGSMPCDLPTSVARSKIRCGAFQHIWAKVSTECLSGAETFQIRRMREIARRQKDQESILITVYSFSMFHMCVICK